MKRELICPGCAETHELHPNDIADGFMMRKTFMPVKKPKDHCMEIQTQGMIQVIPLSELVCDHCSCELPNGSVAVAVTMWRKDQEEEPGNWEQEYQ